MTTYIVVILCVATAVLYFLDSRFITVEGTITQKVCNETQCFLSVDYVDMRGQRQTGGMKVPVTTKGLDDKIHIRYNPNNIPFVHLPPAFRWHYATLLGAVALLVWTLSKRT